ncbi:MAG: response regulator transcription factor [Thermoleophilaceae bacterium]
MLEATPLAPHATAAGTFYARAALVGVLSAFALVAALTLLFQTSTSWGLYSLFVVPVAIAARRFGAGGGVAVALPALGLIVLHSQLAGIEIGLGGYVARSTTLLAVALLAAPRCVVAGERVSEHANGNGGSPRRRLTPRELEVLRLLALGHTNAEVADKLCLSVRTVESHRARLQRKLMRRGRSELTRYALEHALIEPAEARA